MDRLEEAVERLAILELTARYADTADHQDWAALTAFFTPSAVLDGGSVYGRTWTGTAEILDFYEHAPLAIGHHPTGVHTTFDGQDLAHTRLKMLVLFRRAAFTVDYDLQLRKLDSGWKIERLALSIVGRNELVG
jgi:SnoaL-like domain